jgi:uncharacterized membrane protein YdjX (TVP38/TMEM64 family)
LTVPRRRTIVNGLKKEEATKPPLGRRVLSIIGFPLFLLALLIPIIIFRHDVWSLFTSPHKLEVWVTASGPVAPLVFIAIQVVHVIVFVIPGEVVQVAGGFLFGTWQGTLYSVAGILIGSPIDFYLARLLGVPFVNAVFPPRHVEKAMSLLGSRGTKTVFFLLFLIPGIPKDLLCYVAGLTPMRFGFFIALSTAGRLPGIIGSSLIGSSAAEARWGLSVSIFAAALVLSVAAFLLRARIEEWLKRRARRPEE